VTNRPALEPALKALIDQKHRHPGEHATPDALVAYHAGELPADEQEKLQDHLALCAECAGLLQDLVSFEEHAPPQQPLTDAAVEAAWQKVRSRLEPTGVVVQFPRSRLRQVYALAASLFLCVVGLTVWGLSLQRQLAESAKPRTDVDFQYLAPEGEGTRGAEKPSAVQPGKSIAVLQLINVEKQPEYELDLVDGGGRTVWTSPPLHEQAADEVLTVEVSRGWASGVYRGLLFGLDHGSRTPRPVATYRIEIAGPPSR
jgi:hypothetical protein